MPGLDHRHGIRDGRISDKHGSTKIKNMKDQYPELKDFQNDETLANFATGTVLTVSMTFFRKLRKR